MNRRRVRLLIGKEFTQLRRDPLLVRVLLIMPVLQLIFFGYVVSADVKDLATAVVDLDHTTTSRQIEAEFAASGYFTIVAHPASESELTPLLDTGRAKVAIVITEGTEAALTRGETAPIGVVVDGSDSTTATIGSGYASQIIARFNAQRRDRLAGDVSPPGVDARVRVLFNPTLRTLNTMIPGLVAALMMISMMVVMSQAVVKERERGTLEQMFVTPIRPTEYLIGKVAPYALLATAQIALVALVGLLWFRVPFHGRPLVVVVGLGLFMLTAIGMGLLVSLVSHTRQQAQQTVLFVMMPMMLLSGFIFPVEAMPALIRPIAYLLPLTYALDVLRSAAIKGSGFAALADPLVALAAFGVVIFGSAVAATHRRLTE